MPIITITKEDVEKARKARAVALEKDPDFKAFNDEMESHIKEAAKKRQKEAK